MLLSKLSKTVAKCLDQLSKCENVSHNTDNKKGMETRHRKMKSAENQLSIMLLLVTILYLFLQIPPSIRNIYVKFLKQDTPAKFARSILTQMLSYALYITSSGVNFFLYCISGNKFRKDLKEMLFCEGKTFLKFRESKSERVFTLSVSQSTLNSNIHSDRKGSMQ